MILTPSEVLKMIDPVDPDSLYCNKGTWVAKWCPPVLGGDIEALKHTPGIKIVCDEFEPENLPGWAAVMFLVTNE